MSSLEKDIKIAELESKVNELKKKVEIYKNTIEQLDNGECARCLELKTRVRQLEYQNTELRLALVNPRNAGRKRTISDETIYNIGKDYLDGMSVRELAEKYNLSKTTIYKTVNSLDTYIKD